MRVSAAAPDPSAQVGDGGAPAVSRAPLVAILAGGEGRRLGGDKALAPLRGAPLISYPLRAAADAGLERVVVAKRGCRLPVLDCETVHDEQRSTHPASGICAAQRRAAGRPLVVLACDMPFLTGALIAWLALRQGSAVVEAGGRMQPLLARYEPALASVFERVLRERGRLHAAVAAVHPLRLDESALEPFGDPRRLCFNVNDREDLARAERMLDGIE